MKKDIIMGHICKYFKKHFLTLHIVLFLLSMGNYANAQNCTVNAGIDLEVCSNAPVFLYGNVSGYITDGSILWTQTGGPSLIIEEPTNLITALSGLVCGCDYTFRLTAKCVDGSTVFQEVTYTTTPLGVSDAGPDATYCPGPYSLAGNTAPVGTIGEWIIVGNNGANVSIAAPSNPTSSITLPEGSAGSTTLRWVISAGECSIYDEVVITNRGGILPFSPGPDQILSNCYTATTSTNLAGSFAGTGIDGQGGVWTVVDGPNIPTIGNPNAHNTSLGNLIEGIYVMRWTVSGPCASGTGTVQITVPPPAGAVTQASVSSSNPTYCDGRLSLVLSGNQPLYANEEVLWNQEEGPGVVIFDNDDSPTTLVSGLDGSSTYVFSYTITNSVSNCASSATTTISYATPPTFTLDVASPYLLPCNITTAEIPFTHVGVGPVQYSIIDGPADVFPYPTAYDNAGSSSAIISGLSENGTYRISFRKGVLGSACDPVFATISVIVSLTSTGANAGTDQFLACNIFYTSLAGNEPPFGTGRWIQVSGVTTATIDDVFDSNSLVSDLENGSYTFRWLIERGDNCPPSQDDVVVRVALVEPDDVTITAPGPPICFGTPIVLEGRVPLLNEVGTWTVNPPGGVTFYPDINSPTVVVDGLSASTAYTFRWTIENGCGIKYAEVDIT